MFVDTAISSDLYAFYIFFICMYSTYSSAIAHALKIQLRSNEYSVQIVLIFALLPTFLLVLGTVGVLR